MPVPLSFEGTGLGAILAATTLSRVGHTVEACCLSSWSVANTTLILNEKTLWMIGDLFGQDVMSGVVADGIKINHRKVRWETDQIERVQEKSVSVDAKLLAAQLAVTTPTTKVAPYTTLRARGRLANSGIARRPLSAYVWDFPRTSISSIDWCATMKIGQGWTAIAPTPKGGFNLQVFLISGGETDARKNASKVLEYLGLDSHNALDEPPQCVDASCRLGTTWNRDGFSVGDEALSLDPLAGDGVGYTIRAALWVSSLLDAEHLSHNMRGKLYQRRIVDAFRQHQKTCARYYGLIEQNSRSD